MYLGTMQKIVISFKKKEIRQINKKTLSFKCVCMLNRVSI